MAIGPNAGALESGMMGPADATAARWQEVAAAASLRYRDTGKGGDWSWRGSKRNK